MIEVTIEGAARLEAILMGMEQKAGRRIVTKALRPVAKELANNVKAEAPKLTGSLVRSIKVRAGKRRKGQYTMRVVTVADKDTTPAFPVEVGHRAGDTIVPEHPFVRGPFDRNVQRMVDKIENGLWDGVREGFGQP